MTEDIQVGTHYTIGGVECIVIEILNQNQCKILDLFENRERKANMNRLQKIENKEASFDHCDNLDDDSQSNSTEFILTTGIGKTPDDNKTDHSTCYLCFVPIKWYPVIVLFMIFIIGILLCILRELYLIGLLMAGISAVFIICIILCLRGQEWGLCGKHKNKIVFDDNKNQVYWYWNDKLHQTISYHDFSRLGWHRYIWHGPRSDTFYANVYLVTKSDESMRFNWYLTSRSKADTFTTKVNQFWAKKQNITNISNEMSDKYTNVTDNVQRSSFNFVVKP